MTRGRVNFMKGDDMLCSVYVHCDGFLTYLGRHIAELLGNCYVVSSRSIDNPPLSLLGIGDVASEWIRDAKNDMGCVYMTTIETPENKQDIRKAIDYHYYIREQDGRLWMSAYKWDNEEPIYHGSLEELLIELNKEEPVCYTQQSQ